MNRECTSTSILICGSPRVGKSSLVNAICQKKLAKTNSNLESCTKSVENYTLECSDGESIHRTVFWDTPGIESWNGDEVHRYLTALIENTQPICMIYCASPGSFANLERLKWLLLECHKKNIFCALVCTNMWSGRQRRELLNEFCQLVQNVHPNIEPYEEDGITYFDKVGLCTMVNSDTYIDDDYNIKKLPSGINELIFAIAKCLGREKMFKWLRTVSENKSFWSTMSCKLIDLLKIPANIFHASYEYPYKLINYLYSTIETINISRIKDEQQENNSMSLNSSFKSTDQIKQQPTIDDGDNSSEYGEPEIVELPIESSSTTLLCTINSTDIKDNSELVTSLANLGVNGMRVESTNEDQTNILIKCVNNIQARAICSIFQLAKRTDTECSFTNETLP